MPDNISNEDPINICESGFERSFYGIVLQKGYNVTPEVKAGKSSIDMVVEGDNDCRLAIELGGDKYHEPEKWRDDWSR